MIRLWDGFYRHRIQLVSLLIAGVMAGCDGGANSTGNSSATDPKASKRNKDMRDFMQNQPKASNKPGR